MTFGALGAMLDPELEARARAPATHVVDGERDAFARTLAQLRDAAAELPDCRIWACAAAVQAARRRLGDGVGAARGVMSTPQFLREVAGAQLVVV